jgi:pimeloyl-ACP methyl ester carboxylesterase
MGFGYSTRVKTSDYSTLRHAQIVKKFIDHFGLEKVSLVGNSLGAEVVLQFAAAYPDVVEKLVLIDGPPSHLGSFPFYFAARIPMLNKALLYIFMLNSYSAANIYRTAYFDRSLLTDEELERSLRPLHVKGTADALIAMTRSELATLDFSKIPKVETLIIWGREDAFINVQQTNKLESVLPHSKLVILENAGHVPHVEKPDDVNRLLLRFLFN